MLKEIAFIPLFAFSFILPNKSFAGPGGLEVFCHKNGILLWHEQFYTFEDRIANRAAEYCERVQGGKATMRQIRKNK
ncbi:hypothetical protein [Pseudoalteromonas luteoviolacea]|uniref:Uncharacterized protein n=1 Tax=Pseudoalteromonas luteoviolacea H33 TaxID=1365251 RepID=A0A162A9Z3_9GAMM|nr:hypothetical protein [Pseudoalteromonas luteoviolacea]KZN46483.1 hypothetical protein N476_24460 [Pseudoalteromonas luteoviolacea H33]KZN79209.1 hypothetical protein N477_06050 [Pseudoalteromonas luteoviolacea H33-S]